MQRMISAIRMIAKRSYVVADAAAEQTSMLERLRTDVDKAYDEALDRVDEASADALVDAAMNGFAP